MESRLGALALTGMSLSVCSFAHADGFDYTFTISGFPQDDGVFAFYEPALLTKETVIPGSDFYLSTNPDIGDIIIDPTSPVCPEGTLPDYVSCVEARFPNLGTDTQAYKVPLTAPGTYIDGYMSAFNELVITPVSAPTPEPSSLALLGTGLLGTLGAMRRRFAARQARRDQV